MVESEFKVSLLQEDSNHFDLSFKVIVIGDSGVGKSCLTLQACKNQFDENSVATVGFEFFSFNMKIDEKVVKLQIWDTCGQEIYRSLITNFYRNSSLAIILYSVDNEQSFSNVNLWLKELRNFANPDIQIYLIGSKTDLEDSRRVTFERGEKLAKSENLNLFLETSAKTGFNAKKVFTEAGITLYKNYLKYSCNRSRNSSLDSTPIDAYNSRIKFPSQTNKEPGRQLSKDKKCCK